MRDGIPYAGWTLPEYAAIAQTGVRFDISSSGPTIDVAGDIAQIDALAAAVPGSIASVEGPNEFNTSTFLFNGQDSYGNPPWSPPVDSTIFTAQRADGALAGTTVIAASMANAGMQQIIEEGDLSAFVDSANWHVYYGNGDQPGLNLGYDIALAQLTAPGKPVTITETGYYTAIDALDWGGGGVDPHVQAIQTLNALLDAFRDGVPTTYIYELLDNIANPPSTDLEDSFGLFLADGTPKIAATAIHNLTAILADSGSTAGTFKTGWVRAFADALPASAAMLLFEQSNGSFNLVIWNEVRLWDETTRQEIAPVTSAIRVRVPENRATISVLDPLVGTAPVQVLHNVRWVPLVLAADPVIVQISPKLAGGQTD